MEAPKMEFRAFWGICVLVRPRNHNNNCRCVCSMDSVCTMMEFLERLQNLRSGYDLTRSRAQNVMPVEDFERLARAVRLYELDRMQEERNEHCLRVAFDIWKDEICPPLTVDE